MRLSSNVHPRSRALCAAVATVVESLERRRLFSYSQGDDAPIEDVWDGESSDVVFDVGTITGISGEVLVIGKGQDGDDDTLPPTTEDDGSAKLVTRGGTVLTNFTNPDSALVDNFGYDVAVVGNHVAIAAFHQTLGPIVYIYDSVGGVVDNNSDRAFSGPPSESYQQIEELNGNVLVRGLESVYIYNPSSAAQVGGTIAVDGNPNGGDAIASNGTDRFLVATENNDGDTVVEEYVSGVLTRTISLGAGIHSVSLAYEPGALGDVFIGELETIVYQIAPAGSTSATVNAVDDAINTYSAPASTFGFATSLAVSGDYLLIGGTQSFIDSSMTAYVYNHETGDLDDTIAAPDTTSSFFGRTTAAVSGGFAISDANAAADTGRGQIYFFEREPEAPTGPSAILVGGNVIVTGTGNADGFVIRVSGGSLIVSEGGTQLGSFPLASVTGSVVVNGGNGNDIIGVAANVNVKIEAFGGEGNDLISGGSAADILVGGDGNDVLVGGGGRDLLIGGSGADILIGNTEDDILIAGYTSHDGNPGTLRDIMTVWTGGGSFSTRVSTLRNGLLAPEANVEDDDAIDILSGNQGTDWFIFNNDGPGARDLVLDRLTAHERANMDFIPAD